MTLTIANENFTEILGLIQSSKQKAYKSVNKILVELYFEVGKILYFKTQSSNWGKSVIKELASFIQQKDPNIKGFSERNLWRMKQFYELYKDDEKLYTLWTELS